MMVKKLHKEGIKHPEDSDNHKKIETLFGYTVGCIRKRNLDIFWCYGQFTINLFSFCRLVFFVNISTYLCIFRISTIQTAFEWVFICIFNRKTFHI